GDVRSPGGPVPVRRGSAGRGGEAGGTRGVSGLRGPVAGLILRPATPPGREAVREGGRRARRPDVFLQVWPHAGAHPTAGATCQGAWRSHPAWTDLSPGVHDRTRPRPPVRSAHPAAGSAGCALSSLAFHITLWSNPDSDDPGRHASDAAPGGGHPDLLVRMK